MKIVQIVECGKAESVYLASYSGELQITVPGGTVNVVFDLAQLQNLKTQVLKGIDRFEEKTVDLADNIKAQRQQKA